MPTFGVVEDFDEVKHICPGLATRPVNLAMHALHLQCREEALYGRVVPDLTRSTHA